MKQLLYLIIPSFLLLLISCQKSSDTPQLNTSTTSVTLSGDVGGVDSFMIQSSVKWTISVSPSTATWIKTSITSGNGNNKVLVTALENNLGATVRTATITISPLGNSSLQPVVITVTQKSSIPNVLWSKLFGGTSFEAISEMVKTADGGYIIAGSSGSNNGDVSGSYGGGDGWVMKLDANGNKQWSKLFGGTINDAFFAIFATSEGGYLMAGSTNSHDVDVNGNHGSSDAWVLKMDANGNKQWSKLFGGTASDALTSIAATNDGGYVMSGYSYSNNDDVSGNNGGNDAWVIKLDANGNKQWSKLYGGTQNEGASTIIVTTDGGFVIAGSTSSNNGDFSGNHGESDTWVMKLDASGNKKWIKLFGGTLYDSNTSIIAAPDGGYLMAGSSNSNDGDVNGNHGSYYDAWLVKLDANGNKQWSKLFGGTQHDGASFITATADGGYVMTGFTYSNDGDISGNKGNSDALIIKVDANGNKQWGKLFGGTQDDVSYPIIAAAGSYVIAGESKSNDGDFNGNHGDYDVWLMKLKP
ncbi:BACON domain-containing protein [Chitinophagaceae bacterium LB-8]|uniref:BACON domain-containing protein n=1 Tax=Paraflavisolibacter caeni TaxID=2982496 RepID=A0A9X2XNL6_9BACT|nr:BACON domain-containing protein [Paraflavisolibacter caeni]MCU7549073.1 BACON domain-containing protein [Paraflavisolibacter caeni]